MRIRGYAAGAPCWAEVASPDPAVSTAFYGALFGWRLEERVFHRDGRPVAGLADLGPGHPPAWLTYVATDDVAATAASVEAAGGAVRLGPRAVADLGTAAVCADPGGGVFGAWQRGTLFGAHLLTEPGALCWFELATEDVDRARAFYGAVFEWTTVRAESTPGDPYFEWHHHQDAVAGLVPIDHRFPADVPAHWTACFMVDDCGDAVGRITELGGDIARKPMPVTAGWYARVADPTGAHFAVIELNDELRSGLG